MTPPPRSAERPNRIVPGALLNALNALLKARANVVLTKIRYDRARHRAIEAGATLEDIRRVHALVEKGRTN